MENNIPKCYCCKKKLNNPNMILHRGLVCKTNLVSNENPGLFINEVQLCTKCGVKFDSIVKKFHYDMIKMFYNE